MNIADRKTPRDSKSPSKSKRLSKSPSKIVLDKNRFALEEINKDKSAESKQKIFRNRSREGSMKDLNNGKSPKILNNYNIPKKVAVVKSKIQPDSKIDLKIFGEIERDGNINKNKENSLDKREED